MARRSELLTLMPKRVFQSIPPQFRTPNCHKTQAIITNALSSEPFIQTEHLENGEPEHRPLQWLELLKREGKTIKASKVCRLSAFQASSSPPPMANIQREPEPADEEPIVIEDEETPVAEISKGSENEILIYTARVKNLESQVQMLLQRQQKDLKSSSKTMLKSMKSDLAYVMRTMKSLAPLQPKRNQPQKAKSKRRPTDSRRHANNRLAHVPGYRAQMENIRQQRANKRRAMQVNQPARNNNNSRRQRKNKRPRCFDA